MTCNAILKWAGCRQAEAIDYRAIRERGIELMADTLAQNLDFSLLEQLWQEFIKARVCCTD